MELKDIGPASWGDIDGEGKKSYTNSARKFLSFNYVSVSSFLILQNSFNSHLNIKNNKM